MVTRVWQECVCIMFMIEPSNSHTHTSHIIHKLSSHFVEENVKNHFSFRRSVKTIGFALEIRLLRKNEVKTETEAGKELSEQQWNSKN